MIGEKWSLLKEKTEELSLRERGIIAGTVVVLMLVVWAQFVFTPYEKEQLKITNKQSQLDTQIAEQAQRISDLSLALENNPNAELRAEQEKIKQRLQDLRNEIEGRLKDLIAPEEMADVMRDVLSDYRGLKLVSARNLPVEPIQIRGGIAKNEDEGQQAVVFAHGFEMTLKGEYFQTLAFLQRLEEMQGFYWQSLKYDVDRYPNATIVLRLSTLSLEEDWIGV